MTFIVWFFSIIILWFILNYQRASFSVWIIALTVLLIVLSLLLPPSWIILMIIWLSWFILIAVLKKSVLRQLLFSKKIYALFSKKMPHFSATEQSVVNAGKVGWEGEIFSGMPDFTKLQNLPWLQLSRQEQAFLEGPVATLCSLIDTWKINHTQTIPSTIWDYLKKEGFFGLVIPSDYGGKNFSALGHAAVITKIASVSTAIATLVSVPNSLGPAELLIHYGTAQQKDYYLPRLARGEEIPCFALTSPFAGSDAGAMIDEGVICNCNTENGPSELGIRLNWNKRYITLAPVATLLGLAFKLKDPDNLLAQHGYSLDLGITVALVPVNTPGVKTGRQHIPLLSAFPNGPTEGKDVVLPLDAIIGGVSQAGKGWRMLMERLAAGRGISLPSFASGNSKKVALLTGAYARARRQFNRFIGEFGGVQEFLATIVGDAYLIEALRLFNIAQLDQGIASATAAAISKYHTTEMGRDIIEKAMDIHGGKGICMGPRNYLSQLHIEAPIAITVEGANILTRSLIIFGQGLLRCHPYLLKEMDAVLMSDKQKGLVQFDCAFFSHLAYLTSNGIRALLLGLINPRCYRRRFLRFCAIFAFVADMLSISLGDRIKRQEQLSGRLGDLLSFLYMNSAVIKYFQVVATASEEQPIFHWCMQQLFYQFEQKLDQLLLNVPKHLAYFLRLVTLPLGKRMKPPQDNLQTEVAKLLLAPNSVRQRLANGTYEGPSLHQSLHHLEEFLLQIIAVEPLLKKMQHDILSQEEREQVEQAEKLRMEFIAVDAFD